MNDSPLFPETLSLAVHEFRTPLSVAVGYLGFVLNEQVGPVTEKQRKFLGEVQKMCGRLKELVDEMSDVSRLETRELALAKQEFDINVLVQGLANDMHDADGREIHIDVNAADGPLVITGDRARLARALGALMYAVVRERPLAALTAHSSVAEYDGTSWAVLAIGDASEIESLRQIGGTHADFNEWTRGLGLALPVARRIIEAHGGAIWSAANPQSKAASALRLPLRT